MQHGVEIPDQENEKQTYDHEATALGPRIGNLNLKKGRKSDKSGPTK